MRGLCQPNQHQSGGEWDAHRQLQYCVDRNIWKRQRRYTGNHSDAFGSALSKGYSNIRRASPRRGRALDEPIDELQNLRTWIISEEDSREWKERHFYVRPRR